MQKSFLLLIFIILGGVITVATILGYVYLPKLESSRLPESFTSPNPSARLLGSTDELRKDDIDTLHVYLRKYYADNNKYPKDLIEIEGKYIIKLRLDPITKQQYSYLPTQDFKNYTLKAHLSTGEGYVGSTKAQNEIMEIMVDVDAGQIRTALGLYKYERGQYPENLDLLLQKDALAVLPKNPYTMRPYTYSSTGRNYSLILELPNGKTRKWTDSCINCE